MGEDINTSSFFCITNSFEIKKNLLSSSNLWKYYHSFLLTYVIISILKQFYLLSLNNRMSENLTLLVRRLTAPDLYLFCLCFPRVFLQRHLFLRSVRMPTFFAYHAFRLDLLHFARLRSTLCSI